MINNVAKEECCGCRNCENICPKSCITMVEDYEGFLYPKVNSLLCIECNLCEKVCPIKNDVIQPEKKINLNEKVVYAAYNKNLEELIKSSSGGIFSIFARDTLLNGGIVCGCTLDKNMTAKHIIINNVEELQRLRGSKYIQSDISDVFVKIKNSLIKRKYVLFVGTPCQVDGLLKFLRANRINVDKLFTIDLICHGVPSNKIFKLYINNVEKKNSIKIKKFNFRKKINGFWSLTFSYEYEKNNKEKINKEKHSNANISSYYYGFLNGMLFRPICYKCKYSNLDRKGDITLGDFWGVKKYYNEINDKNGVSAIIINSDKGIREFNKIKDNLIYFKSDIEKVISMNKNLITPSKKSSIRDEIYKNIDKISYGILEKKYLKPKYYFFDIIKNYIPTNIKNRIKNILK